MTWLRDLRKRLINLNYKMLGKLGEFLVPYIVGWFIQKYNTKGFPNYNGNPLKHI